AVVEDTGDTDAVPRTPAQFGVALVGGDDGAEPAGLGHEGAQRLHAADDPGGVAGRVNPHQLHPCTDVRVEGIEVIGGHRVGPGQAGADVVGRIGDHRPDDDVA